MSRNILNIGLLVALLAAKQLNAAKISSRGSGYVDSVLDCVEDSVGKRTSSRNGGPNACEVKLNSKPWMVRFEKDCGGTLIAKNIVLTAKHCIPAMGNIAYFGDHSKQEFDVGQRSIRVKKFETDQPDCPSYPRLACDLALAILEEDVQTNEYIQIAKLPNQDEQCPPGKEMVVCGWGSDAYNETRSRDKLWCVSQECVELSKCRVGISHYGLQNVKENLICVTDTDEPRNSACAGDSGGPLTHTDENGTTTLYGVVLGLGDYPECMSTGIMSRVSNEKALEWIKKKIAQYA